MCVCICNTHWHIIAFAVTFFLNHFRQCSDVALWPRWLKAPSLWLASSALLPGVKACSIQRLTYFLSNCWVSLWENSSTKSTQRWHWDVLVKVGGRELWALLAQFLEGTLHTNRTVRVGMILLCVPVSPSPNAASFKDLLFPASNRLQKSSPVVAFHSLAHNFILWKFEKYSRKFIHRQSNQSCAFSNSRF